MEHTEALLGPVSFEVMSFCHSRLLIYVLVSFPSYLFLRALALLAALCIATFLSAQEPRPLTRDSVIESRIVGRETHVYSIFLNKGQLLRVSLREAQLDLGLQIRDATDAILLKSDRHPVWKEELSFEAPEPSSFRIVVTTAAVNLSGSYRLECHVYDQAAELDRVRERANQLSQKAFDIAETSNTRDSAATLGGAMEAIELWKTLGESDEVAYAQIDVARLYRLLGQHDQTFSYAQQAAAGFQATANAAGHARALRSAGIAVAMMGRFDDALDLFAKALAAVQIAGDPAGEATAYSDLGTAEVGASKTEEAIEDLRKSVALSHRLGARSDEAVALSNLGWLTTNLHRNDESARYSQQAVEMFEDLQRPDLEAGALLSLGGALIGMGESDKALEVERRSVEIRRKLKDPDGIVASLEYVSEAYVSLGRYEEALAALDEAEAARALTKNANNNVLHLLSRARILMLTSSFDQAVETFHEALNLARAMNNRQLEAEVLSDIADVYRQLGQEDRAFDYAQRSMDIFRLVGGNTAMVPLQILGSINLSRGRLTEARRDLEETLTLARNGKDKDSECLALIQISRVDSAVPDTTAALKHLQLAVSLALAIHDPNLEAQALKELGAAYVQIGDAKNSRDSIAQAMAIDRRLQNEPELCAAQYEMARVERLAGHLAEARADLEEALSLAESLRQRMFNPASRLSWFSTVQDTNRLYVDTLMRLHALHPDQGLDATAFDAAERGRARALLDLLTQRDEERSSERDSHSALESRLARQLDVIENQRVKLIAAGKSTPANPLNAQIADLQSQLEQVQGKIGAAIAGNNRAQQALPLNVQQIQIQLDDGTLLLEYLLGPERSYLWVVSRTSLHAYELPGASQIVSDARAVYASVTIRGRTDDANSVRAADKELPIAVDRLSRAVLGPIGSHLASKRLVIVTDGPLDYIPFCMLTVNVNGAREPLLLQHEIVSLPSASVLAALRKQVDSRPPAPRAAAIFADPVFSKDDERIVAAAPPSEASQYRIENTRILEHLSPSGPPGNTGAPHIPRLPFTRREASDIGALVPAAQRWDAIGFDANRENALSPDLASYRYLHFATHAWLDSERPDQSAIILSLVDRNGRAIDGFLRAGEIFQMRLSADLVTLSACQTGLGRTVEGEGVVGLTRAFLYAGAARVVVSSWNVSDPGTEALMRAFYRGILQDGISPAAALRAAQIQTLRQKNWKSPYYWAAFSLHGEWR
jgi:CHAT domain-containing protein/tetratricopeptide (TPR) repeat protein